ncbi:hypothetical protein [Gelidibacter salicanalis]|nr:hypothetical protein [Gelidibacter salicanalis]
MKDGKVSLLEVKKSLLENTAAVNLLKKFVEEKPSFDLSAEKELQLC